MRIKHAMIATLAAVAAAGTLGAGAVLAAEEKIQIHPTDSLVAAIAERFNLNTDDVQAVFDEQHARMEDQWKQDNAERMADLVADGKLTQEQADAMTAHFEEQKAFKESLKDLSEEERRTAIEQHHKDMQAWIEENNIPEDVLFIRHANHPGLGPGAEGFGVHHMKIKHFEE